MIFKFLTGPLDDLVRGKLEKLDCSVGLSWQNVIQYALTGHMTSAHTENGHTYAVASGGAKSLWKYPFDRRVFGNFDRFLVTTVS